MYTLMVYWRLLVVFCVLLGACLTTRGYSAEAPDPALTYGALT
jgi:hypothetical protein